MKIKAILLDLDGTLRDSREAMYEAFEVTLREHADTQPTKKELQTHIHHHEAVRKAFAADADKTQFETTFRKELSARRPNMSLYDNAAAVVEDLHSDGYKLAIVSTATTSHQFLTDNELRHYFETIISPADVANTKPHPEPVLLALERLGVQPNGAVMVGDLPADIEAAKRAGPVLTIGLTHGFGTRAALEQAGADYIIDSLAELPGILEQIEQK